MGLSAVSMISSLQHSAYQLWGLNTPGGTVSDDDWDFVHLEFRRRDTDWRRCQVPPRRPVWVGVRPAAGRLPTWIGWARCGFNRFESTHTCAAWQWTSETAQRHLRQGNTCHCLSLVLKIKWWRWWWVYNFFNENVQLGSTKKWILIHFPYRHLCRQNAGQSTPILYRYRGMR